VSVCNFMVPTTTVLSCHYLLGGIKFEQEIPEEKEETKELAGYSYAKYLLFQSQASAAKVKGISSQTFNLFRFYEYHS
jgi:hypothetical protein